MPGPSPATVFHQAGPGNVRIPRATGDLVNLTRDPNSFAIMEYAQIVPTEGLSGYYAEWSTNDAVRVPSTNDSIWPDGQERPDGEARQFKWRLYDCQRHARSFRLGNLSMDQSDLGDLVFPNSSMKATQMMTERTIEALSLLETSGTWGSNTAATVDALLSASGASWGGATAANQYIKKSFNAVLTALKKSSGGTLQSRDLRCVVDPVTAAAMAESAEIGQYLTAHDKAIEALRGSDASFFGQYGLPPVLYNIRMVVEDAVKVSTRIDVADSETPAFCMTANKAVFVYRQGGIEGAAARPNIEGKLMATPTLSTVLMFAHEEMTVEARTDAWHRLTEGSVVDTRDFVVSTPITGYLIQDTST